MGISAGGKGAIKSDINVTPLVDIVLVLLIIFLVTMPVLMRQITIEVPRNLGEQEVSASHDISVLLRVDGTVIVNDGNKDLEPINRVDLAKTVRPMLEKRHTEKVVFVDFEDDVAYGDAVSVMDTIKGAGASKVALKIREEDQQAQPGR